MSLNEENRHILVKREMEKAEIFYQQALQNATIEIWDVVANRLYYSIFHAVCALLIHHGFKVGTHKGAVAQFGHHFVVTGIFSVDEGRFYSRMQSIREKADYSLSWNAKDVDFKTAIKQAKDLLDHIKQVIGN